MWYYRMAKFFIDFYFRQRRSAALSSPGMERIWVSYQPNFVCITLTLGEEALNEYLQTKTVTLEY